MRRGVILLILSALATAVIAKEKEEKKTLLIAADKKAKDSSTPTDLKVEAQSDSPTILFHPNGSPPNGNVAPYPPSHQLRYIGPGYAQIQPIRSPHSFVVLNPQQSLQKPPSGNSGSEPRYIFFQQPDHSSEKANGNELLFELPVGNSRPLLPGNRGIKPELQSEGPLRGPVLYTGSPPPVQGRYPGPAPPGLKPHPPPPQNRFPGPAIYPARPGLRLNRYVGPLTPGYSRYHGPPIPPPSTRYPGPPPGNNIRNQGIPHGSPPPSEHYHQERPIHTPTYRVRPPPQYHPGSRHPESHHKDLPPPRGNQFPESYSRPFPSGPQQTPYRSPSPPHSFSDTQAPIPPRPPSQFTLEDARSFEDLPQSKERYPGSGIVRKPSLDPPGGRYPPHESSEEDDDHYSRNNYDSARPPPPGPSSPDLPSHKFYPPVPTSRHPYPKSAESSDEDHSDYSKHTNTHSDSPRPPPPPPPRSVRPPSSYGPVSSHSSSSSNSDYRPGYSSYSSSPHSSSPSDSNYYQPQSNFDSDRSPKYHTDTSSEEDYHSHPPSHHSNILPYSRPSDKPESSSGYKPGQPVGPPSSQVPVYKPPLNTRYKPTGPPPSLKHHSEIPSLRYIPEHPSLQSSHHSEALPPRPPPEHSGERYEHPIPPRHYYGPPPPPSQSHNYRNGPPHDLPPQEYRSPPPLRKPVSHHGPPDHYPPEDYNSLSHHRDESSSHENDYNNPRPFIPHEPIAPHTPRVPKEPRRPKPPRASYTDGDTHQNSAAKNQRHRHNEKDDAEEEEEEPSGSTAAIPGEAGKDYPILSARPSTNFNCQNKPPGYYADIEHRCQVYYLCGPQGHLQSFLCPNGTIFNQATFVCEWWYNVDCDDSVKHYARNNDLYKVPDPELKNAQKDHHGQRLNSPVGSSRPSRPPPSHPQQEHRDYYPPEQHIDDDHEPPSHSLPEYRPRDAPHYPPSHQYSLPPSQHHSAERHPLPPPPPPQRHSSPLAPPPPQRHSLPLAPPPPSQRHPLPPHEPPQRHPLPPSHPSERHPLPPPPPPHPSERHPFPQPPRPSQRQPLAPPPPSQRHPLPPPNQRHPHPNDYRGAYSHPDESRYHSSEEDDGPYIQESFQSTRITKPDAKKTEKDQSGKKKD